MEEVAVLPYLTRTGFIITAAQECPTGITIAINQLSSNCYKLQSSLN
jgi:hypothetical protein